MGKKLNIEDFDTKTQDFIRALNKMKGIHNIEIELVIGKRNKLMKFKDLKKLLGI